MIKPYLVGITGGIGAGKTIISQIFKVLGTAVYDADTRAKWLMEHDLELINQIKKEFGAEAYNGHKLNRVHLSRMVFSNQEQLKVLNQLVHPAVASDFALWCDQPQSIYVIKEAALLIESGSYKELDTLIVITAPEKLRMSRTLARDSHRTEADVKAIMTTQLSDAERIAVASYVIQNDESALIIPQVTRLHELFLTKK